MDRLHVNPADPRFINDGIVVVTRVDRLASFDAALGAHPAEDEGHRLPTLRGRADAADSSLSPCRGRLRRCGLTLTDGAGGFLPGVPLCRLTSPVNPLPVVDSIPGLTRSACH